MYAKFINLLIFQHEWFAGVPKLQGAKLTKGKEEIMFPNIIKRKNTL